MQLKPWTFNFSGDRLTDRRQEKIGVAYGLSAFIWWGGCVFYFKAVAHVSPEEVLAHRIIWTALLLVGLLAMRGRLRAAAAIMWNRKKIAAIFATTVLISINWFVFIWAVANDQVLALAPADWVAAKDRLSVAAQGMFALGCARAALDVVGDHPPGPALTAGLDAVRTELLARVDDGEHYAQALSARGRAIAWMGRCAHAAVTASAGSANLAHHPAQRIWRECLVFTVLSQSPDVRAATLAALAR